MRKRYFPMFFDISDKKVLVVGGGKIATRRVKVLLEFCNRIVVIAPEASEEIRALSKNDSLEWREVCFKEEDLKESEIVFAATNDKELNHEIGMRCKASQILVNVADNRSLCDFYFPGVVIEDEVVIGINTGGESPEKTKEIREFFSQNRIDLQNTKKS